MENLLEQLGLSSVSTVGISISAANIIEMICIDKSRRMITKYACKELKYNNAIREIISYDDLAAALQELFKEVGINPKNSNVVLNIPNVHFAFTSLPLVLPDEQISGAIASEVEEMYLFKRHEPVISWNTVTVNKETDKRYIVFGAIQENTIQNIRDIFDDLGCKLVAVETAHSSMIKGIVYSRVLEEEFENNETTNIMLINSNSYSIFCMQGKKLVDYFEEPLAIKSFSSDEVYIAISSAANSTLENYPAKNLLVVSETNEVSAEILCHKINFDGTMKYLDRNMYADKSFMEISAAILPKYLPMISLEAVGAAAYTYETYPIKFNFLLGAQGEFSSSIVLTIFDQDYEIDRRAVMNIGAIIAVAVLCLFLLASMLLSVFDRRLLKEISLMSDEFVDTMAKVNATSVSGDVGNIFTTTKEISDENAKETAIIFGLGSEIPNDVYLTSFYSTSKGDIRIEGSSNSSESIYAYVKGLKAKDPKLKITKLELNYSDESASDTVYSFLIDGDNPTLQAQEQQNQEGGDPNNPNNPNNQQQGGDGQNSKDNLLQQGNQPTPPAAPAANAPGSLPAPTAP